MARAMAHALLFAARELGRKVVLARRKADHGDGLVDGHGVGRDVGHQRHVLAHREAGNQVVELKDKTHMLAPVGREGGLTGAREPLVGKPDLARAGHIQPAQNVQQGGFAAARSPQQNDEFALHNVQVHIVQRMHLDRTGTVGFAPLGAEDCGCARAPWTWAPSDGKAWEAAAGAWKDSGMALQCACCLTGVNRLDQGTGEWSDPDARPCLLCKT